MPPLQTITGQDVASLITKSLGGYANAVDQDFLYSALNEGKNEIWMILKELKVNYFAVSSQNTDSNADYYFPQLSQSSRQYTLPIDFSEMRFLEVLDVGYEDIRFEYRPFSSVDYQEARRGSTNEPTGSGSAASRAVYYWDIIGKNQLVLAQYPEINFNLIIWYVRIIPDVDAGDALDEVLYPYVQKIAEYATQKLTLALQDQVLTQEWRDQFKASVVRLAQAAGSRQSANPVFVIDYEGYPIEN